MRVRPVFLIAALVGLALAAGVAPAADKDYGLKTGTPDLKSAGAMAFGPNGILFIADPQSQAVFAIDTGDTTASKANGNGKVEMKKADERMAGLLGTTASEIAVADMAVNP